ncbi:MAG: MarR family winged helix-turn-helix transcriptional regulator [Microbacteriaceae bacterium]
MTSNAVEAWESLFRAQVRVLRVLHHEFPDDELSFTEYDVLFTIAQEPQRVIRLRDLTRNVLISQSSVSRLVDRLVARGLVTKCSDPNDARGALVTLTEDGLTLFRRAAVRHTESINRVVGAALNASELDQLRALTHKLQAATPDVAPNSTKAAAQGLTG